MRIALCHSMSFADKVAEVEKYYQFKGHQAQGSSKNSEYVCLSDLEREKQKVSDKMNTDAIKEHWDVIKQADSVLVLNYDKKGIPGYIGGNSFLEMGFAHVLNKPIYLLQDIPDIEFYKNEIEAMRPTIIGGKLDHLIH